MFIFRCSFIKTDIFDCFCLNINNRSDMAPINYCIVYFIDYYEKIMCVAIKKYYFCIKIVLFILLF